MALKKEVELATGHVAEYWKITRPDVNKITMGASFEINLFKDKAASDAKKAPCGNGRGVSFQVSDEQASGTIDALIALAYNEFKTNDQFFEGAENA